MPTAVHPGAVYDAMATYLEEMREKGEQPPSFPMTLYQVAAERLGMNYSGLNRWQRENAEAKFTSQVRRILYKLADAGLLVQTGSGRSLSFITPEENARRRQEESDRAAAAADELAAWRDVKRRLRALGLIETGREGEIVMPLPVWGQLLNIAEKGETCLSHLPCS